MTNTNGSALAATNGDSPTKVNGNGSAHPIDVPPHTVRAEAANPELASYSPASTLDEATDRIHQRHLDQIKTGAVSKNLLAQSSVESDQALQEGTIAQNVQSWTKESEAEIKAAITAFGNKKSAAEIDWNVVRFSLFHAAALYLRDFSKVKSAILETEAERASADLTEARREIDGLASLWDMNFLALCDLLSDHPSLHPNWSGPYCGAFFTKECEKPFIVVAFKGTTWFRLDEWDVDLHFQPMEPPGGQLFDSHVSTGIYTSLFAPYGTPQGVVDPFDYIIKGLQDISTGLKGTASNPVPVYVTGHSLGASYSTLFYAECLRRYGEKGAPPQPFILRDLNHFASPRVGLADFAEALAGACTKSGTHTWRVVNTNDLVPTIPPVDPWEVPMNHIDQGYLISASAKANPIPSEVGKGYPQHYNQGNVIAHETAEYYAAVKNTQKTA